MPTYIPGISASGTLAPGLTPAVVRAVLELLSSAEIAAAYLPLAGGVPMAGNLDMDHYQISNVQAIDSDEITLNGLPVASEQYASNASNLSTGTVSDNRLSANVPLKNAASNAFTGKIVVPTTINQTTSIGSTVGNGSGIIFQSDRTILCGTNGANLFIATDNRCQVAAGWLQVDSAGSAASPSIRMGGDTTTGLYRPAANEIGFTVSGTQRLNVTSTGVSIGVQNSATWSHQSHWALAYHGNIGTVGAPVVVGGHLGFTAASSATGAVDTRMVRASAGVISVLASTSTADSTTLGSLNLANLTASGQVQGNTLKVGSDANKGIISYATNAIFFNNSGANNLVIDHNAITIGNWNGATTSLSAASGGAGNANRFGNPLLLNSGQSTGNGAASYVAIQASPTGSSGTASNGLVEVARFAPSLMTVTGDVSVSGVTKFSGYPTSLLPAAASNAGSITYDTTLSKHVGCNGSSWNALW